MDALFRLAPGMPFIDDFKERPTTALFGHGSVNTSIAQLCLMKDMMSGSIECKEAQAQLSIHHPSDALSTAWGLALACRHHSLLAIDAMTDPLCRNETRVRLPYRDQLVNQ